MRSYCIAALLATVAQAIPVALQQQSIEFFASVDVAHDSLLATVDQGDLFQQLVASIPFDDVSVRVDKSSNRRQMQASQSLTISYTVSCGANCDSIAAAITAGSSNTVWASALIDAITAVGAAAGFANAVISTPEEVAASITAPVDVTITLPPAPSTGGLFTNGGLDGPVVDNAIDGWFTVAATLSIVDADGRTGVLQIADAGSFSSVSQTIATEIGTSYFITYDVWATPLDNTAGQPYCTTTDSNGLLDIHEGTDTVLRHGEKKMCPIENLPGQWQTVGGLYTASAQSTTFTLHSESGWAAYFDSIQMVVAPIDQVINLDQMVGVSATGGPGVNDRGDPNSVIDMDHTPGNWVSSPTADFPNCDTNVYMTIDLGAVYPTTGVTIWHYYGNDRAYCNQKLAVSTTGAFSGEETTVFDTGACSGWCTFPITCENAEAGTCTPENYGPTEAADGNAFTWDGTDAQYVRHWSGRGQNSGVHFMEIDVYGFVGAPCGGGGFTPVLNVHGRDGAVTASVKGPCCFISDLCGAAFDVRDAAGNDVGKVSKLGVKSASGVGKELLTDADNYTISFPPTLDVESKAALIGALLLLDYTFFEDEGAFSVDPFSGECRFKQIGRASCRERV